jgi:hypothetical protein
MNSSVGGTSGIERKWERPRASCPRPTRAGSFEALWGALATEHHLPWPEHHEPVSDVLDRAAQFYAGRLTAPVLHYLVDRGFPETFVRQRRIGYAPVSSSSRDLLVREIRSTTRSNGTQLFQEAIEADSLCGTKPAPCVTSLPARPTDTSCFQPSRRGRMWFETRP